MYCQMFFVKICFCWSHWTATMTARLQTQFMKIQITSWYLEIRRKKLPFHISIQSLDTIRSLLKKSFFSFNILLEYFFLFAYNRRNRDICRTFLFVISKNIGDFNYILFISEMSHRSKNNIRSAVLKRRPDQNFIDSFQC